MGRVVEHHVGLEAEGVEGFALEVAAWAAGGFYREAIVGGCQLFSPGGAVFGDGEGRGVDERAAVGEAPGGWVPLRERFRVDLHWEVDESFRPADSDAVVGEAGMHDIYEALGFRLICRDEEEVVDEPQQECFVVVRKEGEMSPLEIGVEIVAKGGRKDRSLRDTALLAIVFLADFDEITLDVRSEERY